MAKVIIMQVRVLPHSLLNNNNMENKEENTGMSLAVAVSRYPLYSEELDLPKHFNADDLAEAEQKAFVAGASWQSSQPINSGWVKIDSSLPNQIPDEDVWVCWIGDIVEFIPKGEFIPLSSVSHYMLLVKPSPPKQFCPQCKTEFTKEELLINEHCFKCGFEMKGF
jgi:hypothetical protein